MAKRSSWLRWTLGILAVLIVAVLAAPFLIPVSGFIPQLADLASKKIGQPVAIEGLELHLVPTPRAVAKGIRIGKRDEVRIGELEIVPELLPLLAGHRVLSLIRAEKVELKQSALDIPKTMPKEPAGEPVAVKRIVLRQVKLQHAVLKMPEFDAEADLGGSNAIEQARFETRDGALRLRVDPQPAGTAKVELQARKWTLPAGAPLSFDALAAEGTLKGTQLELPKIQGRLYGGSVVGSARVNWQKLFQLNGKLDLAGIDLAGVQKALGRPAKLTGRLSAKSVYSASAKAADQLANALVLDAPFEVADGAWQGMDLARVVELPLGKLTPGGATKFDELKGKLAVRGRTIRVNELCARATGLVAGGYAEIAPDQKLSGKLDVSVAKTGGFVGVPVALAGTVADPSVSLTKGAAIGAVIGTVLLPGIGTAAGASAGARVEGGSGCK